MAELATIARPYANAAFRLAKQESRLDEWSRMLKVLGTATKAPPVRLLLDSPDVIAVQKAFRLAEVCGEEVDDRGKRLLQVLADNDRLGLLDEISVAFEELKAAEERSLDVEVVSAFPVSDEQAASLKAALERKYEKQVTLESRVDQTLLGGAVIRAGDTVIDGSIRGKLQKLSESLQRS